MTKQPYRSPIFDRILKSIPLETRFRVSIEMSFIDLLTELGYRENKLWTEEEEEQLRKLCNLAQKLSSELLTEVKEWEEDGRPE